MSEIADKLAETLNIKDEPKPEETKPDAAEPAKEESAPKTPALDSDKVTVLFVLGGPGSGADFHNNFERNATEMTRCQARERSPPTSCKISVFLIFRVRDSVILASWKAYVD